MTRAKMRERRFRVYRLASVALGVVLSLLTGQKLVEDFPSSQDYKGLAQAKAAAPLCAADEQSGGDLHSPTSPRGRDLLSVRPSPVFSVWGSADTARVDYLPEPKERGVALAVPAFPRGRQFATSSPKTDSGTTPVGNNHETHTHAIRRRAAGDDCHDGRDRRPSLTTGSDPGDSSVATECVTYIVPIEKEGK